MQEIKKQSIVIASILKPVDDTRMFEKMGKTLAESGNYDVYIVGYGQNFDSKKIKIHSLGEFNRISFKRLFAPIRVLRYIYKIGPDIIIVNTHELLNIAIVFKLFLKSRVIYDVTENYYLNIIHTNAFPFFLKYFTAGLVRLKEWITSPFIHHFLLAENIYAKELPFISKKFTIVENKCALPKNYQRKAVQNKIRLLFTGTIDSSTGIWEVISLCKLLHEIDKRVELHIAGYCTRSSLRFKILREINSTDFISYQGINHLVSHTIIIEEISKATAGVVFYPPSPHNKNRVPTKVFEYLACQLPILFDTNVYWKKMVTINQAGVGIDFRNPNPKEILDLLTSTSFFPAEVKDAHWSSEAGKLLSVIS